MAGNNLLKEFVKGLQGPSSWGDSDDDLESRFTEAMMDIYRAGLKLDPPYNATRFQQMIRDLGGKEAANQLLAMSNFAGGFTELFTRNRLDLSVEYLVLKNPWRQLFNASQLDVARKRLEEVHYSPPTDDLVARDAAANAP